jgi:hypothetical protein
LEQIRAYVLASPIVEGPDSPRTIAFEIKKTQVTSGDLIPSQVGRRESLHRRNPSFDFILITTGGLTNSAKELIAEHKLTVWDVDDLAQRLNDEVRAKWFGVAGTGSRPTPQPEPSQAES